MNNGVWLHPVIIIERGKDGLYFDSVVEASRYLNVTPSKIKYRINNGKSLLCNGHEYYFDYALED